MGAPQRGGFWSPATDFAGLVTRGRDYLVLGLGLFDSVLLALIRGDDERPTWLPVALFDLPALRLPHTWEFAVRDGLAASGATNSSDWQAIWGYPELVHDPAHSDQLIEREVDALCTFQKRWEEAAAELPL